MYFFISLPALFFMPSRVGMKVGVARAPCFHQRSLDIDQSDCSALPERVISSSAFTSESSFHPAFTFRDEQLHVYCPFQATPAVICEVEDDEDCKSDCDLQLLV